MVRGRTKGRAKTSKTTRSFIQRHIRRHKRKGMDQKRAVAAAYSEARRKGHRVPKKKKG
jgi:hypothetical protein